MLKQLHLIQENIIYKKNIITTEIIEEIPKLNKKFEKKKAQNLTGEKLRRGG